MERLVNSIIQWADDRGLIENSTPRAQILKVIEECGEMASHIVDYCDEELVDDIGDIIVTIVILNAQTNTMTVDRLVKELEGKVALISNNLVGRVLSSLGVIAGELARNRELEDSMLIGLLWDIKEIAHIKNIDFTVALTEAYNEIKDRKGYLTKEGIFIKEEDDSV